ncbi:SigB/SigF/SigG family RNA polymerase sigma factor [Arsenicicoccus sp. oral taxon 190]|uniref:SigB/SigF/SigG family RNA polymerase sigma factor n=1 Tax=Arsenicicoccus sp. oral taxon 190 TaxID=1658671 RepID=UPI00067A3452|nr:SigB/SigF/SigG family RNA polymerase sigma factor [Arsenicicoccus sp. oral taxon 190]AKT51785.1 hypothetical protein ADJ73_11755 [Arsenicicoccus sp. oral taxon 190]
MSTSTHHVVFGLPHVRPVDTGESERLLASIPTLPAEERQAVYNRVIQSNIGLAKRLASRYRNRGEPQDDLEQVANLGLVMAVLRFDPSHGVSLVDFATPTIIGELRKHFRDKCWSVRPPRRLQELRPRVRETEQELEQKLGRAPTSTEVADAMGLTPRELADVEQAATGYQPLSLEHPTGEGAASTLGHLIPDEEDDLEHLMDEMMVHTLLDCLTPRQRKIIELRYFSEMTQQEIADEIGVSQVQVSRLLTQILNKLRNVLQIQRAPVGSTRALRIPSESVA